MQKVTVTTVVIYLIILAIIVTLVFLIIRRDRKKEGFKKCICSSREGREENCQDIDLVDAAYEDNILTENTNLVSPGWSTDNPGQYDYPHNNGCNWPDSSAGSKQWVAWDYTDFGSTKGDMEDMN